MKKQRLIYNLLFALISLVLMLNGLHSVKVYSQQYTEYEVRAAYLFNFAKFVKWPESAFENETDPFVIGVFQDEDFEKTINKMLQSRTLNERKVIVKTFMSMEELEKCHILYIPEIKMSELLKIFEQMQKFSALTVGNSISNFCESGGMINFTRESAKRFEINNKSALRANLKISSKLLSLAKIITEDVVEF